MTTTPESIRADLGKVAQGVSATRDATASINRAASDRLDEVNTTLSELRPATLTSEAAARQYSDLMEERGTLHRVLGLPGD